MSGKAWLQELIDRLNQQPEPVGIVQSEVEFIRLCHYETPERGEAFRRAYGDDIRQLVDRAADLYQSRTGRPVTAQERREWIKEIENGFYAELPALESAWVWENAAWLQKLVSAARLSDPITEHWTTLLTDTFNGLRRSLRRRVLEYADQWLRQTWLT